MDLPHTSINAVSASKETIFTKKAWCMLNMPISMISFEAGEFLETVIVSAEDGDALAAVFAYAEDVHKYLLLQNLRELAVKIGEELHFLSLIPFFKLAADAGISPSLFANWLKDFYGISDKISISESYNTASSSHTGKTFHIMLRHDALKDDFYAVFAGRTKIISSQEEDGVPGSSSEEQVHRSDEPVT